MITLESSSVGVAVNQYGPANEKTVTLETILANCDTSGGDNSCWPWLGSQNNMGYGQKQFCGKVWLVARLAWFLRTGAEIPKSKYLRNHCRNPLCLNPKHAFIGMRRELSDEQRSASEVQRFWKKVKKTDSCWNWVGAKNEHGYGQMGVKRNGKVKHVKAHRMSLELSGVTVPSDLDVLHRCDNPACVNPAHLYIGTHTDNMRDIIKRGRHFTQKHPKNRFPELYGSNWFRQSGGY